MRRVVIGPAGVAAIAMVAGCGPSSPPLSAPVTSMDELHRLFTHAASSQQTWTVVQDQDSNGEPNTMTCKVQVNPIKASDCISSVNPTVGDTRTITLPDAEYLATTNAEQVGDGSWYRYAATDSPELANTFKYPLADLGTDFYFLPGIATIAATHADHVDGRDATRYDLDINTQAPRALPVHLAPRTGKSVTETVQIWIGARDLPVRIVIRTTSGDAIDTITTTYRDWGESLNIQAPPATKTQPGPH
ncbi:hypothetical protein ACIRRA_43065 [Nocardia sp. NPDC101769]|uniref:hypothetical protein n=1 Tax=Nocardia sp. NPDC101769 TaxID=3364333 RepID=UPI00382F46DD